MVSAFVALLLAIQGISCFALSNSEQDKPTPSGLVRRMARHFPDRPPLQFEIDSAAEHGPRIIITNLHQYALTAVVIKREPTAEKELPQTMFFDALTRSMLLAPVPRGLSFIMSLPQTGGGSRPSAMLAAAAWEDGSTFGPDDLLAEITAGGAATADMYRRTLPLLRKGLEENWQRDQYLSAAEELKRSVPLSDAIHWAETAPPQAVVMSITSSLQAPRNTDQRRVEAVVKGLIVYFKQSLDTLQEAAGAPMAASR